ncbi:hypothetical protein CQA66_08310 [Helicobacter aurati]|uniref:Uncharacterized protein n=1 Tax=Helicobacter aurati TaxID=137778 RepID=A0A3D8J0U7_9HELI|nr:hypothetical protein [Helicobacter aurati]RDU70401.1 hypothetical protein CQA66_08310 [Helicobacter aurati]
MSEKIKVNKSLIYFSLVNKDCDYNNFIYFTKYYQFVTNGKILLLIRQDNHELISDIAINAEMLSFALIGRKLEFEFNRLNSKSTSEYIMIGRFKDFQDVVYRYDLITKNKVLNLKNVIENDFKFLFTYNICNLLDYQFTNIILLDNILYLYDKENNQYVFEDKINTSIDNIDIEFNSEILNHLFRDNAFFYFDYEKNISKIVQEKDDIELYVA